MAYRPYPKVNRISEMEAFISDIEARGEQEDAAHYDRLEPAFNWITRHYDVAYLPLTGSPMLVRPVSTSEPQRSIYRHVRRAEPGENGWKRYSELRNEIRAKWREAPPMDVVGPLPHFLADCFHKYAIWMDLAECLRGSRERKARRAAAQEQQL